MFWPRLTMLALGFALFLASGRAGFAQAPTTNHPWAYLLLDGSTLTDDCPICGRPTIQEPMRGTFQLRLLESNPLFARLYNVRPEDVLFSEYPAGNAFKATIPRLVPSGDVGDTDVYGAQQHAPLLDGEIPL